MESPPSPNPYAAPVVDVRDAELVATEKGRRLVLAVIVTIVALSVLPGALSAVVGSQGLSALAIARIVVSVALCVFLYRRANWARVVSGSVMCLVAIASVLTGLLGAQLDLNRIALIVFGLVYLGAAFVLLFVPAVRAYFGPNADQAWLFAVIGLIVQCALIVGLVHFVVLALLVFRAITASGSSDPQAMAYGLGQAMIPLLLWGALGALGLLTTAATLLFSRYRARWFYVWSWVFALLYLLFVPVGTLISLGLIAVLILKRREFRK